MASELALEREFEIIALKQALTSTSKEEVVDKFIELVRLRHGERAFFVEALKSEAPLLAEEVAKNEELRSRLENYTKEVERLTLNLQSRLQELQVELLEAKAVQTAMSEDLGLLKERNSELLSQCDRVWGFFQQAKREDDLKEVLRLIGEASRSLPRR